MTSKTSTTTILKNIHKGSDNYADLTAVLDMSKSVVRRQVKALQSAGLIEVHTTKGKPSTFEVTKAGRKLLKPSKKTAKGPLTPCGNHKGDGKRTSAPGCADWFRSGWSAGESFARADLIEEAIKTFGRKARWSVLNYIALAKKGEMDACPTIVETDGILTVAA